MQRIFTGATVRTMDPARPVAEVVVIRNGKITRVGRREDLDIVPERDEEVIDLGGGGNTPGFYRRPYPLQPDGVGDVTY